MASHEDLSGYLYMLLRRVAWTHTRAGLFGRTRLTLYLEDTRRTTTGSVTTRTRHSDTNPFPSTTLFFQNSRVIYHVQADSNWTVPVSLGTDTIVISKK